MNSYVSLFEFVVLYLILRIPRHLQDVVLLMQICRSGNVISTLGLYPPPPTHFPVKCWINYDIGDNKNNLKELFDKIIQHIRNAKCLSS